MKAIRVHDYGPPEVLRYEEAPLPSAGKGEVVVKIAAAGINFLDVVFRRGSYKQPNMPYIPGGEASGTIHSVGEGVSEFQVGERVVYAMGKKSYAEYAAVSAARVVKLPENVDFQSGCAIMQQGMSAHYLSHSCFPLKSGHRALIHAGAGGVGLLLTQMAKKLGATVYATVSSEAKADSSRAAGADATILYTKQDFEAEVKRLTDGRGVDVVYDSIGAETFDKGLNCLRPRGYMVLFGLASGPVPPFDPSILGAKGSLFLTRPGLPQYTATREELLWRVHDLFQWLADGQLKLKIDHVFPLQEAAKAHEKLEARRTSGKLILLPFPSES